MSQVICGSKLLKSLLFLLLQTQSAHALQEKDVALKKCKRLEEEMETIRVYYRLESGFFGTWKS